MFHLEEIFTRTTDILVKRWYCLKLTKLKCTRSPRFTYQISLNHRPKLNKLCCLYSGTCIPKIFDILVFAAFYGKV